MDWIACLFEILGAYTVGNKNKMGFILHIIGNFFWFSAGWYAKMYGLMIVSVVFFTINVRNYIKWRKEAQ